MEYREISTSEAINMLGGTGVALVNNIGTNDISSFVRKTKLECESIIEDAIIIIYECDDFIKKIILHMKNRKKVTILF